jgi:hypothetical protein
VVEVGRKLLMGAGVLAAAVLISLIGFKVYLEVKNRPQPFTQEERQRATLLSATLNDYSEQISDVKVQLEEGGGTVSAVITVGPKVSQSTLEGYAYLAMRKLADDYPGRVVNLRVIFDDATEAGKALYDPVERTIQVDLPAQEPEEAQEKKPE